MKLLISGAGGQLGRCLQDRLVDHSEFQTIALTSSQLDICSKDQVYALFEEVQPDIVVNAAAYTAVDKAEDEAEQAQAVNATGVENLASACATHDIPLIHVSTDYVFDGNAKTPYQPDSPTSPIGVYGASKLRGEQLASDALGKLVILRTAWVYSEYGNNFVKTMLRLAESRYFVSVVDDQIGCPTYAGNIAQAIIKIAEAIGSGRERWGVYHYVDDRKMSWHAFAEHIFDVANDVGTLKKDIEVKPIPSSEFPTKTKRPAYSVLDASTLNDAFGVVPSNASHSLDFVMRRLNQSDIG